MESPPYFPRANGLAERGLLAWKESTFHMDFTAYLQKILLHHRIATSARGKSTAEIIFGRQLRVPIMSTLQQGDPIWYRPQTGSAVEQATYLMTGGQNTSWVINNGRLMLASNQIAPSSKDSEGGFTARGARNYSTNGSWSSNGALLTCVVSLGGLGKVAAFAIDSSKR